MMSSWRSVVSGCGAAVVGALLLTSCSGSGSGTSAPHGSTASASASRSLATLTQGSYVALGDSYTAGPDIPVQGGTPAGCDRSSRNYPSLVAQSLGFKTDRVRDVSCSGATIADLTGSQSTSDGVNAAQLSALSSSTTLITLGVGGNDVDFAGVLTHCVEVDLIPSLLGGSTAGSSPCQAYYTSGGTDQIEQKIRAAATSLADALGQISQRAPHASVFVVGYLDLLPSGGDSCADTLGITSGDLAFLNEEELRLNAMLQAGAKAAGAVYVNTYTPSQGHDACAEPSARWTEPLEPASPAAPLHPNARGEQGMADAVLGAIKSVV
jgi:lysophospholipase L1-like esterase